MSLTIDSKGSPVIVTGTTSTDAQIMPTTDFVNIRFIYWYNPTTEGHLCNITDGQGRGIIKMRAFSDNDTQMWPVCKSYYGIRCDDMDSGTLYIYIR